MLSVMVPKISTLVSELSTFVVVAFFYRVFLRTETTSVPGVMSPVEWMPGADTVSETNTQTLLYSAPIKYSSSS